MAAICTSPSTRPNVSLANATTRATSSFFETSACTPAPWGPASAGSLKYAITKFAPFSLSCFATSFPIRAAPVMMMVFPFKSMKVKLQIQNYKLQINYNLRNLKFKKCFGFKKFGFWYYLGFVILYFGFINYILHLCAQRLFATHAFWRAHTAYH